MLHTFVIKPLDQLNASKMHQKRRRKISIAVMCVQNEVCMMQWMRRRNNIIRAIFQIVVAEQFLLEVRLSAAFRIWSVWKRFRFGFLRIQTEILKTINLNPSYRDNNVFYIFLD